MADREITVETLPGIKKLRLGGEWFIAVDLADMDPEAWLEGKEEDEWIEDWRANTYLPVWYLAQLLKVEVRHVVSALENHAYNDSIRRNQGPWDYEIGTYVDATEFTRNTKIARYWLTEPPQSLQGTTMRKVAQPPVPIIFYLPMPHEHYDDFDDVIRWAWWNNQLDRHKVHDVEAALEVLEAALKPLWTQIEAMERDLAAKKARESLALLRQLEVLVSLMRYTGHPPGQLMFLQNLELSLGQLNIAAQKSLVAWYLETSPQAKYRDALAKKVMAVLHDASDLADGIVDMWMHEEETPEQLWDRVVSVLDRTVEALLKTKQAKHLLEEFLEPVFRSIAQLATVNVDGTTLADQIASFSGEGLKESGATTNVFERVVNVVKWSKRGRSALVVWANFSTPHLLAKLSPTLGKSDTRFATWAFRLLVESASLEDDLQEDLLAVLEQDKRYVPGLLKKFDTGVNSTLLFKQAWLAWGALANVAKLIHAVGISQDHTVKRWQAIIEGTLGLAEAGVDGALILSEARASLFHLRFSESTKLSLKGAGKALGVAGSVVGMGFSYWALSRAKRHGDRRRVVDEHINFALAAAAGIAAVGGGPVALGVLVVTLGWELGLWIRGLLDEETEKYFRKSMEAFVDDRWVELRSIEEDKEINRHDWRRDSGKGGRRTLVPDYLTLGLAKAVRGTYGSIDKPFEFWPLWDGKSTAHRDEMKKRLKENGFDKEAIKKLLEPDD